MTRRATVTIDMPDEDGQYLEFTPGDIAEFLSEHGAKLIDWKDTPIPPPVPAPAGVVGWCHQCNRDIEAVRDHAPGCALAGLGPCHPEIAPITPEEAYAILHEREGAEPEHVENRTDEEIIAAALAPEGLPCGDCGKRVVYRDETHWTHVDADHGCFLAGPTRRWLLDITDEDLEPAILAMSSEEVLTMLVEQIREDNRTRGNR